MNCTEYQDNMAAYMEGVLDPALSADYEAHAAACPACRQEQANMAKLHQQLLAHGQAANTAVANRVMLRITKEQTETPVRSTVGFPFFRWAAGLGAIAAVCAVMVVLFSSSNMPAKAAEVMAKGVRAVQNLASVHIQCRVRTAPAENFGNINPQAGFVPVELWKEVGNPGRWRVEKPGRVAVMDGQSSSIYLKSHNTALKVPQPSKAAFDTGWLHALADIEGTLAAELQQAQAKGWPMSIVRETDAQGAVKAVVTVEAKSDLPESDYLKNAFFSTADTRRVYRFDDASGRLEALQVYLRAKTGDVLVMEVDRIEYNPPMEDALFQLALPETVKWMSEPQMLPRDPRYSELTAEQAARAFFEACAREDWQEVAQFWPLPLDERLKKYLGGVKLVSLGEPFTSAASNAKFIPYQIELRGGHLKKHNLALKQHKKTGRWYVDGGI